MNNTEHRCIELTEENLRKYSDIDVVAWYARIPDFSDGLLLPLTIIDSDGRDYYLPDDGSNSNLEFQDVIGAIPALQREMEMREMTYPGSHELCQLSYDLDKWKSLRQNYSEYPPNSELQYVGPELDRILLDELLLDNGIRNVESIEYDENTELFVVRTESESAVYDRNLNPLIPFHPDDSHSILPIKSGSGYHFLHRKSLYKPEQASKLIDTNQEVLFSIPYYVEPLEGVADELYLVRKEGSPCIIDCCGNIISEGERILLSDDNILQYQDFILMEDLCRTDVEDYLDEDTGDVTSCERSITVAGAGTFIRDISVDTTSFSQSVIVWKPESFVMKEYRFDKWPGRTFHKVEPRKDNEPKKEKRPGCFWYLGGIVLGIVTAACYIYSNDLDGWREILLFLAALISFIGTIGLFGIGFLYSAASSLDEEDEYKKCIGFIEGELGEKIEGEFELYHGGGRDVDIIILKVQDADYIKTLLNTVSKKQDWPVQKKEDGRITEERHVLDGNVFTSWRKNFDSSDVAGITVEVKVNGNKNEITYESVIY